MLLPDGIELQSYVVLSSLRFVLMTFSEHGEQNNLVILTSLASYDVFQTSNQIILNLQLSIDLN